MFPTDSTIRKSTGIPPSKHNPDNTPIPPNRQAHIHHTSTNHQVNPTHTHSNSVLPLLSTLPLPPNSPSHLHLPNSGLPPIRPHTTFIDTRYTPPPSASHISMPTTMSHTSNDIQRCPPSLPLPGNEVGSRYTTPHISKHI